MNKKDWKTKAKKMAHKKAKKLQEKGYETKIIIGKKRSKKDV